MSHIASKFSSEWSGSAWQNESTFHQLSPYIGKTKSSMAAQILSQFTGRGDVVLDPFSGCGTFAFEAWIAGRHVIANDLSSYASLLTRAKLFPYCSLDEARRDLLAISRRAEHHGGADLRTLPRWVRSFFHADTLREITAWLAVLRSGRRWFLLACLMGILHHQRPGFLSLPSSHTVPYLRVNKFPRQAFPELYEYRSVADRLEAKLTRAFRRVPRLDFTLSRRCLSLSADQLNLKDPVDAIVTSPPYMRQLDYGRDNRLRLWFLGCRDWRALDRIVSPGEDEFKALIGRCFVRWRSSLKSGGYCVLVIGDGCSRTGRRVRNLPDDVALIATEHGFTSIGKHTDLIPTERRVRRGITGNISETILVLRNAGAS